MKLPKAIKLGAQWWNVHVVPRSAKELDGANGKTFPLDNDIFIAQASAPNMRDTLLHEALHAMLNMQGVHLDDSHEEDVVKALAPMIDAWLEWDFKCSK